MQNRASFQRWWRKTGTVFADCDIAAAAFPAVRRAALYELIKKIRSIRTVATHLRRGRCVFISPRSLASLVRLCSTVLRSLRRSAKDILKARRAKPALVVRTGRRGRPAINLSLSQLVRLKRLHQQGNTWKEIAKVSGFSIRLLYKRLKAEGFAPTRSVFTVIADEDLQNLIKDFTAKHPFSGITMAQGYLRLLNMRRQRQRVIDAMNTVNPAGVASR